MSNLFRAATNRKNKIDVFINDQTNALFQYFLLDEQKTDITLTSNVAINDVIINVSSGHGFTGADGEYITIFENNRVLQQRIVNVSTDAITIEQPSVVAFSTAGAVVIRGNNSMKVNGSVTPVNFRMQLRNFTIPIDISKILVLATHAAAGDYSKFTGISALTNGVAFQKSNSMLYNLGNYRNNKDFRQKGAEVDFPAKAPSGSYATEIIFNLTEVFGQVMRFYDSSDVFTGVVRDDLSSLTSLEISMIGSYTDEY